MFHRALISDLFGAAALVVAAATAACGGGPTSPTGPASYVLSGVVAETTESGRMPVEGAVVRLDRGGSATTDSSGAYSISGVPAGFGTVTVTKDGYRVAISTVMLNADTRVDFDLVRQSPSPTAYSLSGMVYEQTLTGRVPVEGVRVEESYRHLVSMTDREGRYSFVMDLMELGQFDIFVRLHVTKEGFHTQTSDAVVDRDTHLDIEIVRR